MSEILRNLGKDILEGIIGEILGKDRIAAKKVEKLMILWEDIPKVTNRTLQKALRRDDAKKLAIALVDADQEIDGKIRDNISVRTAEEIELNESMILEHTKNDIEFAREEIVGRLREMNQNGELEFIVDE